MFDRLKDLQYSVSATTRKPRKNEVEGQNYYFLTNKQFDEAIKKSEFLEWARVHDYLYGTLRREIDSKLQKNCVILELDIVGSKQVKSKMPEAVSVFIMPPSFEELKKRLVNRDTESKESLKTRLKNAQTEIKEAQNYDYVIINDDLETASSKLIDIVKKERC